MNRKTLDRRLADLEQRAEDAVYARPDYASTARRRLRQACHAVDRMTGTHTGTVLWNKRLADIVFVHPKGAR